MDELDIHAVDCGHELRQGIQLRFALSPVVVRTPVVDQRLHLRQPDALGFVIDRFLVRPACRRDTFAEVDKLCFRDAKGWIDLSSVNMGGVAESGLLMEALTSAVGAVWAKLGRANTARPNTPTPARIATKLRRLSANDARLLRNPSPRLPVVADLEVN